ncbi:hypothetical protein RND71_044050 [Anisodus tanguticus]|uniref:Cadherin domain-containing protein n=1 Tax=Anisodus tanguticus TaxID=243964 RepID=A0AAE1QMT5_9SOLA|nr:hypothetical protein RND71_044050 [Anisodus tanguticus]
MDISKHWRLYGMKCLKQASLQETENSKFKGLSRFKVIEMVLGSSISKYSLKTILLSNINLEIDGQVYDLEKITHNQTVQKSAQITLQINVIDINDNAPIFEKLNYETTISESQPINTVIGTVRATDADVGPNAELEYSINQISAIDKGQPQLSNTTLVVVHLEDANDNPPRFNTEKFVFYIAENSPLNSVVGKIKAEDADEGINALVELLVNNEVFRKNLVRSIYSNTDHNNLDKNSVDIDDNSFEMAEQFVDTVRNFSANEDMASRIQLSNKQEAEQYVLNMIEEGEIFAQINQKDGMVIFLDNPEKFNSPSTLRKLEEDMRNCIQLDIKVRLLDQENMKNPKYIQKIRSDD